MLSMSGGEGPSTGSQRIKSFTKSCAGSGVHSVRRSDWTLPCPSPFPASPSRMMYLSPLVSRPLVKYQCRAGIKYLDYMYTSGGGYHIDIEIYYGLELNVCKSETSSGNFYHYFEDYTYVIMSILNIFTKKNYSKKKKKYALDLSLS